MPTYTPIPDEYAVLLGATERNARGGFLAFCPAPAHPDTAPSLSVNPGDKVDMVFHCFCGCTQEEVLAAINELRKCPAPAASPFTQRRTTPSRRVGNCTLAAMAKAKQLSVEFLESLGLNNNQKTVIIPYRMVDGTRAPRHRRRWAVRDGNGGSTWTGERGSGGIVPYGLDQARNPGRCRRGPLLRSPPPPDRRTAAG